MSNKKRYKEFIILLRKIHNVRGLNNKLGLKKHQTYYLIKKAKQDGIIFSPKKGVYYKRVIAFKQNSGEQTKLNKGVGKK